MTDVAISIPETPEEMDDFRRLNWDYRDFLFEAVGEDADIAFAAYPDAKYQALLDAADTLFRPPKGQMRLVKRGASAVGCGTIQTIAPGDGEIKRVYLTEAARGMGAGKRLMQVLIDDCRALGFSRILMDTARPLTAAAALYDHLGFQRRGPYQDMPDDIAARMLFFEMVL